MVKLRDDQVADLSFYINQASKGLKCMNLSSPGTGKTASVVVNQGRRLEDGIKTAWVQPKSLMDKNVEEIIRFTGLPRKSIAVIDGTPAHIQREFLKDPAIILMGPDRFKRVYQEAHAIGIRALDVDEFHMCFGGVTSKRTDTFFEMSKYMNEGVFMSGTIINGRLDTAYPAIQAIDSRYYPFGYDEFLGAHAYLDDYGRPIAWHNHDKLAEIFGRHGIRRTFESIFGKQEIVRQIEWVSMNPKQRVMFETFRDEAMLEMEKFYLDGTQNPGVAFIRGRQLMEHPNDFPDLTDPTGKARLDVMPGERPAKLDALEIHFEDHLRKGTPLIVFAALVPQQEQIAALARKMGLRVGPIMNGNATRREKNECDTGFVAGRYDVIVGSPAVASVGYNWQFWGPKRTEVDHVIFASLGYMDSDFGQGYKRTIREKRAKPLRITTLAYFDSLDRRNMQILERKSKDANRVDPTQDVIKFDDCEEEGSYD